MNTSEQVESTEKVKVISNISFDDLSGELQAEVIEIEQIAPHLQSVQERLNRRDNKPSATNKFVYGNSFEFDIIDYAPQEIKNEYIQTCIVDLQRSGYKVNKLTQLGIKWQNFKSKVQSMLSVLSLRR